MKKLLLSVFTTFIMFSTPGSNLIAGNSEQLCVDGDIIAMQVMGSLSCITSPVLICPSSSLGCPGDPVTPDHAGQATAMPGDPACPDPIVSYTDEIIMDTPCVLKIHRKWRAEYPAGAANPWLYSECIQIIERVDEDAPVAHNMPADITLTEYGPNCWVAYSWPDPEFTDNCGISSINISHPNGGNFTEGSTTVSYILEDFCGNVDTFSFTITVECEICTTPPQIQCPPNQWRCPVIGDTTPQSTGFATAHPGSLACADPVITYADTIIPTGPCQGEMVILRHWTATEPSDASLTSSCVQTIYVADAHAPVIHGMPNNINVTANGVNCTAAVSWNAPFPSDDCGIQSFTSSHTSGSLFNQGTTTVTYTAVDNCGNSVTASFTVTVNCVACVSPPSIHCPSDVWICTSSSTNPAHTGHATATGGAHCPQPQISYQDWIVSTGPCSGAKVIKRIWTASYPGFPGLSSSCSQFIYKEDLSPPTIYNCPANITLSYNNPVAWWTVPSAHDNCSYATISSNYSPGHSFPYGTTVVTYIATDNCGNTSSCSFTVTVGGAPQPQLHCPNDIHVNCTTQGTAYVTWNPPTYSGNCGNCDSGQYIPGFIFMGEYNGHQYYCSTSAATWESAKQVAASKGGYLASINSAGENSFLASKLMTQTAWIGLNDKAWEGTFKWDNGDPVTYTNWYPGQPNNYGGNQDYVELMSSGKWNDQYNHYSLEYIMELPCAGGSPVQQVSGPSPGSYLQAGTYTVTYKLSNACPSNQTCSFKIYVSGGLQVDCPDDITLQAPINSPGVVANWDEPTATTCCGSCNGAGNYIPGFVYMGSYNGHHYYCSLNPATWPTAKANSQANGGHLAVINSAGENSFIASNLLTQTAYIGLSDHQSEGNFKWVNGDPVTFTNWYPGQPNDYGSGQDYVELLSNGLWNDQYASASLEYVMEISGCTTITQTSGPSPGSLLAPGTQHTVTYLIQDGCGNSQTCSFDIIVESSNIINYCLSGGDDSYEYHIKKVQLGSVINNSSGSNNGYGDYTANCGLLQSGTTYQLSLTPGDLSSSGETKYWKAWIDYNRDGDFTDPNELIAFGSGVNTISGMITTPANLSPGKRIMRVSMSMYRYPNGPCDQFPVGETEDYCLLVTNTTAAASTTVEYRDEAVIDPVDISSIATRRFNIYPNPVSDIVTLEIEDTENISSINIYNVNGKMVTEINDIREIMRKDVGNLENGLYMIRVIYNDGAVLTEAMIVQN